MSWTKDRMPEARAGGLLTEQVGDEIVVYDTESKDVHCLSPLAAAVFEQCDGRTDHAAIAESAGVRLGRPVTKDEVSAAIAQLEERSLLERPPVLLQQGGVSRRDLAKKTAKLGAAVASVPLITSIVAPTAAMAATQIPLGCGGCGKNPDCTSNHCCQNNAGKQCSQGCCVLHDNSCHFCNCVNNVCDCTVARADLGLPECPCVCGPGCTTPNCCTTVVCCVETPAC